MALVPGLQDPRSTNHRQSQLQATQGVIGRILADLADGNERIVVGTADLKYSTHLVEFAERHPRRFFEFGISERNMLSAAAGLATCGFIPYVSTFASFAGLLGLENIRTDIAYPNLPVRILATHSGISMGYFSTSHHSTEDIATTRAIAGLTVLSPTDANSLEGLVRSTVDHPGPIYFRMSRGRETPLYDQLPTSYRPGPPHVVRHGRDLLLVSTGILVRECVLAAEQLAGSGVEATVLDVHTIKPFDGPHVAELAAAYRAVVVVEEHNVLGGLGSIVTDAIAGAGVAVPVYHHGLLDEFAEIGPPTRLYQYYGLDADGIATVVRRALEATANGRAAQYAGRLLWTAEDRAGILAAVTERA
jgi:transketolase